MGLALSGGGTRSAVFSVGVLLALSRHGFLSEVDYLSTVSGGGYAGAALTALTMEELPYDHLKRMGVSEGSFPFAFPRIQTDHQSTTEIHGNESPALRHLRQNTELLGTHPGLIDAKTWTLLGRVLTSGLLLWAVFLLPVITLAALAEIYLQSLFAGLSPDVIDQLRIIVMGQLFFVAPLLLLLSVLGSDQNVLIRFTRTASYVVAIPAAVLGAGLIYGSVTSVNEARELWDDWHKLLGVLSPLLVFALSAVLSNLTVYPAPKQIQRIVSPVTSVLPKVAAGLGGILLAFGGVVGFDYLVHGDGIRETARVTGAAIVVMSGVSTLAGINKLWGSRHTQATVWRLLLAAGGYVLLGTGFVVWCWAVLQFKQGVAVELIIALLVLGGALVVSSAGPLGRLMLNSLSIHRIYAAMLARVWVISARPPPKQTLAEMFPPPFRQAMQRFLGETRKGADAEASVRWHKVWSRDDIRMKHLREQEQHAGPYPLFCAALNIPGSTSDKLLDRKADSFVIAPLYSGSALTHWTKTEKFPEMNKMRLSQAAAISGAAVSPNAGERTSRTFSIITTLLNIRLGRWVRNSRASQNPFYMKWLADRPTVLYWKEMFGLASHEDGQIYLSDGGHFENLGLYELFRRRCRYIVAVSADVGPPSRAFDLGNIGKALRLAIVDFGVSVDMKDFRPLMRDPKTGLVETYYSAATFRYPGSTDDGIIIFIKVGLCEDGITPDIAEFWLDEHPAFPYDSTLNQQFDQPLFESYRHLGYLAGRAMCRPAEGASNTAERYRKVLDDYQAFLRGRQGDSLQSEEGGVRIVHDAPPRRLL